MKLLSIVVMLACSQFVLAKDIGQQLTECRKVAAAHERFACYEDIPAPYGAGVVAAVGEIPGAPAKPSPAAAPDTAAIAPAGEEAKASLDAYLARTLKDPTSAIQYEVSEPLNCKAVSSLNGDCLCYAVNARNSYGGMTGQQLGIAIIGGTSVRRTLEERFITMAGQTSCRSRLKPRDASLIHDAG